MDRDRFSGPEGNRTGDMIGKIKEAALREGTDAVYDVLGYDPVDDHGCPDDAEDFDPGDYGCPDDYGYLSGADGLELDGLLEEALARMSGSEIKALYDKYC